jgi:hypothetical protein
VGLPIVFWLAVFLSEISASYNQYISGDTLEMRPSVFNMYNLSVLRVRGRAGVRHGPVASTSDFCKEVLGSISDPTPKIEVCAALDE